MNPLVAILLGVAVLVIGAAGYFEIFGSASTSASEQNTNQVIEAVFSNVSQQFANNPLNFTGFNNTDAIQASIVPNTWVPEGSTTNITDPWGGTTTFGVAGINGGTANGWTLTLADVPENSCADIASFYTPQTASIQVNGASVATNPNYNGGTASSTAPWPPSTPIIETACSAAENTVEWTTSWQ